MNVLEILDNDIGILYRDNIYYTILPPGQFGFWVNSIVKYEVRKFDKTELEVPKSMDKTLLYKLQKLGHIVNLQVDQNQKGLLYVNGKFEKEVETGHLALWKNDNVINLKTVDTRVLQLVIPNQELLTKDKVTIRVNFNGQYQVVDYWKALNEVKDYEVQLYNAVQLSIREYISNVTIDQLLTIKDSLGPYIIENLKGQDEALGVKILSGGIKDIILPGDVREIMNQVLIAQKKAQANAITRQEETASTRSLLNTAKLLEDNAMLYKLKELEYMEKIADKIEKINLSGGNAVIDDLRNLLVAK
jgi:hypothetical protein